jgi:hypothetical protein
MFALICLSSRVFIGALGILYKLASRRGCHPAAFRVILTWLAAVLSFVAAVVAGEPITGAVVIGLGALGGVCFAVALIIVIRLGLEFEL